MTLRFLTSGESHGPALTVIMDGMPAGMRLDTSVIDRELGRRQKGVGAGPRMKIEHDKARVLSGVMAGVTNGAPISVLIENRDHNKWQGKPIQPFTIPRPGHADLTGAVKYGLNDLRPALERASARETAARVVVGAISKHLLSHFGVQVAGYVAAIGEIEANLTSIPLPERGVLAEKNDVRCPDPETAMRMEARIKEIMSARDTLGGIIEVITIGLPPGLGSYAQWDARLEARLGAAVLSVQAIKGVEIGPAFANARMPGTQVHDAIRVADGSIVRPTNRSGGLEGGITNGSPLIVRAAMKPIATTLTPQPTVDLKTGEASPTQYERSDFCPVPRAVPILEAMVAYVLADVLMEKLGGDSIDEMVPRFAALRQTKLTDLTMDGTAQVYWPEVP